LKACPEWKVQQKILWAKVREEVGRGKSRFEIRDSSLPTRGAARRYFVDFLSITDVGKLVLVEDDAGSEMSGWERRAGRERRAGAEELGVGGGGATAAPAHGFLHSIRGRGVLGGGLAFRCTLLCHILGAVRDISHWDRPRPRAEGGACGLPPSRGQRTGTGQNVRRRSLRGLNASTIKKKTFHRCE